MTHDEIRSNLLAAMDGTLDPDTLDEIERHMAECAQCRMEQVELHRMRRSMDREEEAAAPERARSLWGSLGGGGMMRILLIAAFMGAALWAMTRRRGDAPASPGAVRVSAQGEGVAAGPPGRLSRVARDRVLAPGDEVSVAPGARAVVLPGAGRGLVLEGPASGDCAGEGRWRHRGGRLVAEAGPEGLRLSVGASSVLAFSSGAVAIWEEAGETRATLLAGTGHWEGDARPSAVPAKVYALAPGALRPVPIEAPCPPWVEALREVLDGDVLVVPGVTLIPEGS